MASSTSKIQGTEFLIERVFDAPRELVFRAFSEPQFVSQWWGPKGWTLPVCEMDFREGGTWRYMMRGPAEVDHMEGWGIATYKEIVPPERIVYIDAFGDENGEVNESMPKTEVTVEFIPQGNKTLLRSNAKFASEADLQQTIEMGMEQGLNETWDRLEDFLAANS